MLRLRFPFLVPNPWQLDQPGVHLCVFMCFRSIDFGTFPQRETQASCKPQIQTSPKPNFCSLEDQSCNRRRVEKYVKEWSRTHEKWPKAIISPTFIAVGPGNLCQPQAPVQHRSMSRVYQSLRCCSFCWVLFSATIFRTVNRWI